ncbi:MAG: hypothetical protein V8S74_10385 [Lachnospirales bacterium]
MKRLIALLMAVMFVLGFSGCSDLEKEHFDKSIYADINGINTINETVKISIDPTVFGKGIMDIYGDTFNLYVGNDEGDSYSERKISEEQKNAFVNMLVSNFRIALDENKQFNMEIGVTGTVNYDDMTADEAITCKFNNLTLDVGNCYIRDNKTYMDKKLMYTLGALDYLYDTEALTDYYTALDNAFGDKKYLVYDYKSDVLGQQNFTSSLANSTIYSNINDMNIEYYNEAKEILKNFDTDCVKRTETGTRFELKPFDFVNIGDRFASYIRQHSEESTKFINNYMLMINSVTNAMYGNVVSSEDTDIYGTNITSQDVIEAMDGLKSMINSKEFLAIFRTLNITYTDDINNDGTNRKMALSCTYNNKSALVYSADITLSPIDSYSFASIDVNSVIDMEELNNAMPNNDDYSYSTVDDYTCPECGETFEYIDSYYCNECGFVHDFYVGDENCDKQPGCEIANGVIVA